MPNLGQVKIEDFLEPSDSEICQKTWKQNRAYVNWKGINGPEMAKSYFDLCDLDLLHAHHLHSNQYWKWYNDGNVVKRCDRQRDRKMDEQTEAFIELHGCS